jgi:phytol kinase
MNLVGTMLTISMILIITFLLLLWNLVVIHYLAKWAYNIVQKYRDIPAAYIGRKIVHLLGGGITALLIPVFYEGYYLLVTISAFGLAIYLLFRRKYGLMYWFQIKENRYEVHFALAYGTILLIGVLLGNLWIGLIPVLFISFGDSFTGLIRAITQKRHVKSWEGSLAMFLACSIIGFLGLGIYGVFVGSIAALVEKIPKIDDNVTVPMVTALLVYFQGLVS